MANAYPEFGTVSHATMRPEHLLPAFAAELEHWARANGSLEAHAPLIAEARAVDPETETAEFVLEELFDALNEFAPPDAYFGAHPGDASDYGFWPAED